jgi:redox-sensing transcriptional repressor
MKTPKKISELTVYRLSIYERCLELLEKERITTISSKEFAERFGLNSAQVRKDLAYFGEFGVRGIGYEVTLLKTEIMRILGILESSSGKNPWKTIVVGAGKLGSAILRYEGFKSHGFEIVAAIDIDTRESEYQRTLKAQEPAVPLYHISEMEEVIKTQGIQIGILTVPEERAQEIAKNMAGAGIRAILNFAQVQLFLPRSVKVRHIDMTAELQCLTYFLSSLEQQTEDYDVKTQRRAWDTET